MHLGSNSSYFLEWERPCVPALYRILPVYFCARQQKQSLVLWILTRLLCLGLHLYPTIYLSSWYFSLKAPELGQYGSFILALTYKHRLMQAVELCWSFLKHASILYVADFCITWKLLIKHSSMVNVSFFLSKRNKYSMSWNVTNRDVCFRDASL